MGFCVKEKQFTNKGITCVDNTFILNYLPDALDNGKYVGVYLLGLTLCESTDNDNTCQSIANKLNITPEEVISLFEYWEELGLVYITKSPPQQIVYLNVRDTASSLKKIKVSKYKAFSIEMQNAIDGRMITPKEYGEYYNFLENTTFEPAALIAVAKYCVEYKGNDINYGYILTVARNQAMKGNNTLTLVQESLNSNQKYDEDLKAICSAMDLPVSRQDETRKMCKKWEDGYGFSLDVIVKVAKVLKGKSLRHLDAALAEYYTNNVLSFEQIEQYTAEKNRLLNLAKNINRAIGVYYESLEPIVDNYLVVWLNRGFDEEALLSIATYCFRSGIRTLKGLASVVEKLYNKGITTVEALNNHLAEIAATDEIIKQVLVCAGISRNVTNNDREMFRTWTVKWDLPMNVILFAAEKSAGTIATMAYLNKILSHYKQQGIATLEQAQSDYDNRKQKDKATGTPKRAVIDKDLECRVYTDEQLNALFTALDDTEE